MVFAHMLTDKIVAFMLFSVKIFLFPKRQLLKLSNRGFYRERVDFKLTELFQTFIMVLFYKNCTPLVTSTRLVEHLPVMCVCVRVCVHVCVHVHGGGETNFYLLVHF